MGQRTSVYLSASDLDRIAALGNPGLPAVVRHGLAHMETCQTAAADPVAVRSAPGARRTTLSGQGRISRQLDARTAERDAGCDHPRAARDPKNPARCRCGAVGLTAPGKNHEGR